MTKRCLKLQIGAYKVTVQDYQYKGRPPVAARVSGTRLGECRNPFGEPCFFYESVEAMSMKEGLTKAKAIIAAQVRAQTKG